jgi:RNA polymerase sigma-70 factor (sigma-E family)
MLPESEQEYVNYVSARLARLRRAAYLLCGDADLADDIVQITLTTLYVHWQRATAADNLDAFVHRIMIHRYVDEKRRSWSRVALWADAPNHPAADTNYVEERDLVVAALRRLPKGQRTVVVLRFFCDLSVDETARTLGCSTGNVKSQCARGLAALRSALGRPLETSH